jgi:hypothetical protein
MWGSSNVGDDNKDLEEFQSKVAEGGTRSAGLRRRVDEAPPPANGKGNAVAPSSGQFIQYALNGPGYTPTTATTEKLPAGCYTIRVINDALTFLPQNIVTDRLLRLPDSKGEMVIQEVERFWNLKEKFMEYGFSHKRGYLLWGPPGSGKTGTVALIIKDMVEAGGLVILGDTNPGLMASLLSRFRQVEPDRRVVMVLEDLDAIVDRSGEAELLSLLDGEGQIDNVVFIATTNYPERLDPRIVNRPSRFDRVVKIGFPTLAARKMYIASRLGDDFADLNKWAAATDGLSIAHIKEIIVSVFCLGLTFEETLERVKMMKNTVKNDELSKPIGLVQLNEARAEAPSAGFAVGR